MIPYIYMSIKDRANDSVCRQFIIFSINVHDIDK